MNFKIIILNQRDFLKASIIIVVILLFFGAFSTVFHDTEMVGNIGNVVGNKNIELFGYLAYVDFLILFFPLFALYRHPQEIKEYRYFLAGILVFISMIFIQSLVVSGSHTGTIGIFMHKLLYPYIGKAGLWLLCLMTALLAFVLAVDEDYSLADSLDRMREKLALYRAKAQEQKHYKDEIYKSKREALERKLEEKYLAQELKAKELKKRSKLSKIFHNPFDFRNEMKNPDILEMNLNVADTKEPYVLDDVESASVLLDDGIDTLEEPINFDEVEPEPEPKPPVKRKTTKQKTTKQKPTAKSSKTNVSIVEELEENSKLMDEMIDKGKVAKPKNFKLPKIEFLQKAPKITKKINEAEIDKKIEDLLSKLMQFKIDGDVIRTYSGPLVTTFEFKPAPNVKVSKILGLQDDLAMALSAETIRIQAPIPGRDVVGIEIPNIDIDTIYLRDILESKIFKESSSPLTVALGMDIVGKPFVTDIKKLPHLLIAGTTGSGKSVGINAMILSLLYRNDPDQLKLMLIDPKMLEFSMYNDIPHLITPVITEPMKAIAALANMVGEMERRYRLMADSRTKNIENYNEKASKEGVELFPYIVIVIDELADLMMNGGKEVELSIARLAQKSRACGIHLVVATQRPSVDVVTGLIKANLPSRLSYRVGQRIDSKVILDQMGAESLLGRGDGLFTPPGTTGLVRIHAPWNSEDEIDTVVAYLKEQRLPEYDESYLVAGGVSTDEAGDKDIELDSLYEEAKNVILTDNKTSISYLQRKLQIGYNRSANIIEQLQQKGVLSAPNNKGQREIL